ncbi:MAG: YihY/virulence factor BrkB family protein [Pseudomonadota bacterium]
MFGILKSATKSWLFNQPLMHSAAAAYFAVFSLPGLLILVVSILTFFMDEEFVRTQILDYIGEFIGPNVARTTNNMIDNARLNSRGSYTIILGGGILLFAATGLFNQLKASFNAVWGIQAMPEKAILRLALNRAVSFGVAIMIAFLLLVSMYVSAGLNVFSVWLASAFPVLGTFKVVEIVITFVTISLLFTFIFKILPDVVIHMKYAAIGGGASALIFISGEYGFAKILKAVFPYSIFGAAGTIVIIMLWVTFACMILQFGVELIKAMMIHDKVAIKTSRFVKDI